MVNENHDIYKRMKTSKKLCDEFIMKFFIFIFSNIFSLFFYCDECYIISKFEKIIIIFSTYLSNWDGIILYQKKTKGHLTIRNYHLPLVVFRHLATTAKVRKRKRQFSIQMEF